MDDRTMGSRIKSIRQILGENQDEFGKHFSPAISKAAISKWESDRAKPSSARLKRIAELGNVSVKYITNGVSSSKNDSNTKEIETAFLTEMRILKKIGLNDKYTLKIVKDFFEMINLMNTIYPEEISKAFYETLQGMNGVLNKGLDYNKEKKNILRSVDMFLSKANQEG